MREAKESGEFNGADGKDGADGEKGDQGVKGDTGPEGKDGHTPVKGVDYYTDAERFELIEEVSQETSARCANALKANVSGEVIRVDDVSPIEHTVKAKVGGKNLVSALFDGIIQNADCHIGDDGTGCYKSVMLYLPAGTYTLSFGKAVTIVRVVHSRTYNQSYIEGVTRYSTAFSCHFDLS